MTTSVLAGTAQRSGGYEVDAWMDITLQPMMKLWQGLEGRPSPFFLSEEDAREAKGAYVGQSPYQFAQTLWRLAQVAPHPDASKDYRQGIREFVVDLPVRVAVGLCLANAQFGTGTVLQYFIPNWDRFLMATGRDYKFPAKRGW